MVHIPSTEDIKKTLGLLRTGDGKKLYWLVGAVVIFISVTAFAVYPQQSDTEVQYQTASPERGRLVVKVNATGTIKPVNQVDVGSELSGTVKSIEADFNDAVTSGQVLAQLDTEQLEARVVQARAAFDMAKAKLLESEVTLVEKQRQLKRCKELSKKKLCTPQEMDTTDAAYRRAMAAHASAKAQVAQAEGVLNVDENNLKKALIRSPIDGVVLSRSVEPGQTVAASFQTPVLFTLAEDLRQMNLHVDIDEADVGQVREGLQASFTVDAHPGKRFPALITEVRFAPRNEGGVVTYEAVLKVENRDLLLRPGMTASAEIITHQVEDALLVPNSALRFNPSDPAKRAEPRKRSVLAASMSWHPRSAQKKRPKKIQTKDGQAQVWTLRDGKPVSLPVTLGLSDGRRTQILSEGLHEEVALLTGVAGPSR
jgi:HlyD family secretion protein